MARALVACSRCGGQMTVEGDRYGAYLSCVNCGRHVDLDSHGSPSPVLPFSREIEPGHKRRRRTPLHNGVAL